MPLKNGSEKRLRSVGRNHLNLGSHEADKLVLNEKKIQKMANTFKQARMDIVKKSTNAISDTYKTSIHMLKNGDEINSYDKSNFAIYHDYKNEKVQK